jgi:predicted thioesterase
MLAPFGAEQLLAAHAQTALWTHTGRTTSATAQHRQVVRQVIHTPLMIYFIGVLVKQLLADFIAGATEGVKAMICVRHTADIANSAILIVVAFFANRW